MFIVLILVIIGVVYLFQQKDKQGFNLPGQSQSSRDNSRDALDILRERYAHGEISEQEFNERKKVLQQY